ncbi:metallophosphatase [Bacteroidia bacterium]|nr:metallophosphatase [Bacteroidia bacterium]
MRIIPILLAILGMNFYVFFRLSRLVCADTRIYAPILLTILFVAMFTIPALTGTAPTLYRAATAWFFIALYLLLIFLAMDLLRLALPMQKILNGNLITLGALALVMTAVFTCGYIHYKDKKRVELSITVGAKNLSPLRIVAISDLHLGYTIDKTELDQWIKLINAEHPDLVLIAGDIKDNNLRPLTEQNMAASFRNIKSKYGTFACSGNHEYIGDTTKMTNFFRDANITLLRDSSVLINNRFYIIGREDRSRPHRRPLAGIVKAGCPLPLPIILLDHQPFHLEEAEQNNITLQISGHTHHGQVLPLSWITNLMYETAHGYLRKGNTHIYVSSGIGIWGGKFRIGTQSEYAVIEMKNEE